MWQKYVELLRETRCHACGLSLGRGSEDIASDITHRGYRSKASPLLEQSLAGGKLLASDISESEKCMEPR